MPSSVWKLKRLFTADSMEGDELFAQHKQDVSIHYGLAWIGSKLYVPASQRTIILQQNHDSKITGHFGFVKTAPCEMAVLVAKHEKRHRRIRCQLPSVHISERAPGKLPRPLQPVVNPTAPWKENSMGLHWTARKFGKYYNMDCHWLILQTDALYSMPKILSIWIVTKLFMQHIWGS